jgi:hypothetical protein
MPTATRQLVWRAKGWTKPHTMTSFQKQARHFLLSRRGLSQVNQFTTPNRN